MALVDYSDSDSDDANAAPPKKLKPDPAPPLSPTANTTTTVTTTANTTTANTTTTTLPPIPLRFHELYAVPPRLGKDDDPALHGGRRRAIPHMHGNWPTHVFLECVSAPTSPRVVVVVSLGGAVAEQSWRAPVAYRVRAS